MALTEAELKAQLDARRHWQQKPSFPPLQRDAIESWCRQIEGLQGAAAAGAPADSLTDADSTFHLLTVLARNPADQDVAEDLMSQALDWPALKAELLARFPVSSRVSPMVDALRVFGQGSLSLDRYIEKFGRQFALLGLPPRILKPGSTSSHAEAALSFSFMWARAQFEAGLRDPLVRQHVCGMNVANLQELLTRTRTEAARAAGVPPGEGTQVPGMASVRRTAAPGAWQPSDHRQRGRAPEGRAHRRLPSPPSRRGSRADGSSPAAGEGPRKGSGPPRGTDGKYRNKASRPKGPTCFACGGVGHVKAECPTSKRADGAAALIRGRLMGYEATFAGRRARVLIDPGASITGAVDPVFVERHKLRTLTGEGINCVAWTGETVSATSYVEGTLVSNEFDGPLRLAVMKCPYGFDLVLGLNWLEEVNADAKFQSHEIRSAGRLVFAPADRVPVKEGTQALAAMDAAAEREFAHVDDVVVWDGEEPCFMFDRVSLEHAEESGSVVLRVREGMDWEVAGSVSPVLAGGCTERRTEGLHAFASVACGESADVRADDRAVVRDSAPPCGAERGPVVVATGTCELGGGPSTGAEGVAVAEGLADAEFEAQAAPLRQQVRGEFADVFKDGLDALPPSRGRFDFHIDLQNPEDLTPRAPYRVSPARQQAADEIVDRMAEAGLVTPVDRSTPAYCAAFPVPKSNGPDGSPRARLVVDARPLNLRTRFVDDLLPQTVEEQVRRLGTRRVLSQCDFVDAFFQLPADAETRKWLVVAMPGGRKVQFNVMLMGARGS